MAELTNSVSVGTFDIGNFADVYLDPADEWSDEDFDVILSNLDNSDVKDTPPKRQKLAAERPPNEDVPECSDKIRLGLDTQVARPSGVNKTATKHFTQVAESDLDNIFLDGRARSTLRATNWGINIFKQWLTQHGKSVEFEELPVEELCKHLKHFYAEVRNVEGQYYSKSSFVGMRAAIHRHIRAPPHNRNINILQDKEFHTANNVFLGMLRKLKKLGLDNAMHHDAISPGDLSKIRDFQSVDNPVSLQQKVWFDLTLGFGRRGCENQRELSVHSFAVETDDVGVEYITMSHSEATKNHPGGLQDKVLRVRFQIQFSAVKSTGNLTLH